jgi:hypothetical protein
MSDLDLIYGIKPKTVPPLEEKEQKRKPLSQETPKLGKKEKSTPVSPAPSPTKKISTSLLTTKDKTKYGTYLTDESIQKIRIYAIQTNRDDHQIVQEAVDQYLESLKK